MTQKDYIKRDNPKPSRRAAKPTAKSTAKASPISAKPAARAKAAGGTTSRTTRQSRAVPVSAVHLPKILLAAATLVLAAFGYFLWSINGAADLSAPTKGSTKNTPATAGTNPVAKPMAKPGIKPLAIPPPPVTENWEYIEELKNKTVAVELTEIEQHGPYVMQCATFNDARRAEAFKAQLALLNFESTVKVSAGKNGSYHRVQLGPYTTKRDALRAKHELSKHKINGCKIWLWS